MNLRTVGFALAAVAVVTAVLAFVNADNYNPRAPLAWNLQNATTFTMWRDGQREIPPAPPRYPCGPRPERTTPSEDFWSSPQMQWTFCDQEWQDAREARDAALAQPPPRVVTFRLTLGNALAGLAALGLVGVGLMIFGKKE